MNSLTVCTLLTSVYLAYQIKQLFYINRRLHKQIHELRQMQHIIKAELNEIKNNGYYDDSEEFWEFELKKRKFQNQIDKLNDTVASLQSAHYNYEYLSTSQENLQKEFKNMYRDIKDDVARLNTLVVNQPTLPISYPRTSSD